MSHFLSPLFAQGFFTSSTVHTGLLVGAAVAIVAGPVGVFAVTRGQSFAAEALSDVGATGASAAFLIGVGPLWGFLAAGLLAAAAMELVGIQRPRGRDLATGIVLGAALGLAALFLYLDTTQNTATGVAVSVLFGSLFAVDPSTVPVIIALSVVSLALLMALGRPLLLSSVNPDLAAARGVPVRLVGALYLVALALAVSLTALTIGAILGTALLIGPAATALRLVKRPMIAVYVAAAVGLIATWLAILLAYDSYDWPPRGHGWPVSFFVVAVVLAMYVLAGLPEWRQARRAKAAPARA
ncbi:MAG TPA: metal ABC transporter permease [Solirubrobacteraceae bacterium]|nr:metal ABC transporter permease [Solirubrobacteraceae bacterium]